MSAKKESADDAKSSKLSRVDAIGSPLASSNEYSYDGLVTAAAASLTCKNDNKDWLVR